MHVRHVAVARLRGSCSYHVDFLLLLLLLLLQTPYDPMVVYSHTKTANVWHANEIERRFGSKHLHALSLSPGLVQTNALRYLPKEQKEAFLSPPEFQRMAQNSAQGAATSVSAAVGAAWAGLGGLYLENVKAAREVEQGKLADLGTPGYAPFAFDAEGAQKLWEVSEKLVALH